MYQMLILRTCIKVVYFEEIRLELKISIWVEKFEV